MAGVTGPTNYFTGGIGFEPTKTETLAGNRTESGGLGTSSLPCIFKAWDSALAMSTSDFASFRSDWPCLVFGGAKSSCECVGTVSWTPKKKTSGNCSTGIGIGLFTPIPTVLELNTSRISSDRRCDSPSPTVYRISMNFPAKRWPKALLMSSRSRLDNSRGWICASNSAACFSALAARTRACCALLLSTPSISWASFRKDPCTVEPCQNVYKF